MLVCISIWPITHTQYKTCSKCMLSLISADKVLMLVCVICIDLSQIIQNKAGNASYDQFCLT
jgi:hypothetical protein